MAQTSQCDLLRQPDLMQCGIYCEASGFIALAISRCIVDSSWSSDGRGGSIDEHRGFLCGGWRQLNSRPVTEHRDRSGKRRGLTPLGDTTESVRAKRDHSDR